MNEEILIKIYNKLELIEKKISIIEEKTNKIFSTIEEFEKETENFSPENVIKYLQDYKL